MYAKVQPDINDWYVGMIEQTEPVLSEEDALKFICSHWFVEEKRYDDALSSALKVSLAGRDNSLFWVADNLEREFYELDAKAQKLDAYNMWVRIYAQPECLGKKVYAGKEAFWHFDGKKLHESKGEYLSDKEACKNCTKVKVSIFLIKKPAKSIRSVFGKRHRWSTRYLWLGLIVRG